MCRYCYSGRFFLRQRLTTKPPFRPTFAGLLVAGLELAKSFLGPGEIMLNIFIPVAGITIAALQMTYETYLEA